MSEKLDTPVFKSVMTDDLKFIFELFRKYNFELKIAGGAVRDILSGKVPHDIDFATTATPDQMKHIFAKENIRMINANGEKHGTITIRLNDKENFEITTLRIDVVTDGRHAVVQFTHDWRLDANRRDLTVNSIFLDFDGTIVDFFNGYDDLKNHRIRFVGEARRRIQEDYLRILRYFRFYSRICIDEFSHDEEALKAIKENAAGLADIAGERIWVEFKKIVTSKFADSIMRHMVETNVHKFIGLPDDCDLDEFSRVYKIFENKLEEMPAPITMVCALLKSTSKYEKLFKRMKFSNEEKRISEFIFANRTAAKDASNLNDYEARLKAFKYIMVDNVRDLQIHEKIVELLKYSGNLDLIQYLGNWSIQAFPITGAHLESKKLPKGPVYAKILNALKEHWKYELNLDCSSKSVEILLEKCDGLLKSFSK